VRPRRQAVKNYQHFCARKNRGMGECCFRALFLVGISLFLIVGCEGGSKPAKPIGKPPPSKGEIKPTKVEEKAVDKEVEKEADKEREPPYTYNPVGKRDPFKPFIALGPKKTAPTAPLTPLQRYDVSELKLVGILKGQAGYRALVEDAGGKGFIITKGTPIGRGNGHVKEIHDNRVIIEQTHKDIFGQVTQKEITMPLRKPGEGGVK
jgi:type IV pilus assembly protein PilP